MLLLRFQIVFDKMGAICLDFIRLGFQISDPIRNQDHLQPNLFSTIQNPVPISDPHCNVRTKDIYHFQLFKLVLIDLVFRHNSGINCSCFLQT